MFSVEHMTDNFGMPCAAGQRGSTVQLSGLGAALKEAITALVPRSVAIPIAVAEVTAVLLVVRGQGPTAERVKRVTVLLSTSVSNTAVYEANALEVRAKLTPGLVYRTDPHRSGCFTPRDICLTCQPGLLWLARAV